ncbi:Ribokinase-like protein [Terfezia boudieri ATCC MYA-4762]|uniref:Ribokinase n=1 Tax=Terfezia boudieri ATCC MYA-4762 TaxID=1051890 RepID=A0A3N4LJ54_9PEZI|nr:Ribokinase-like protein [Terfezia boudieri ATCC MYA-4762]
MASPDTRPTILVIGSLNMDLVTHTPRIPVGGETLLAHTYGFHTGNGGKGANQAVAIARLGGGSVRCAMVGIVGDDAFGEKLRGGLENEGVDIEDNGQNRILVSPGANFSLTPSHIPDLDTNSPAMVVLQHEIPFDTISHAIKLYSTPPTNTLVLLNPAPAVDPATLASHDIDLSNVDFLIPNETEAGISYAGHEAAGSVTTVPEAERIAKSFLVDRGVRKAVIITLGGQGVVAAYHNEEGDVLTAHIPAQEVDVVDTTAAGDTFIGGFAASYVEGKGVLESIKKGVEASARTVQKKGAQESIPMRAELRWV